MNPPSTGTKTMSSEQARGLNKEQQERLKYPTYHLFNRVQKQALLLLARGGARYGTRYSDMTVLKEMGLCYAHDNGVRSGPGRWTWRPTVLGIKTIAQFEKEASERKAALSALGDKGGV